jgi:hypothetical protein
MEGSGCTPGITSSVGPDPRGLLKRRAGGVNGTPIFLHQWCIRISSNARGSDRETPFMGETGERRNRRRRLNSVASRGQRARRVNWVNFSPAANS